MVKSSLLIEFRSPKDMLLKQIPSDFHVESDWILDEEIPTPSDKSAGVWIDIIPQIVITGMDGLSWRDIDRVWWSRWFEKGVLVIFGWCAFQEKIEALSARVSVSNISNTLLQMHTPLAQVYHGCLIALRLKQRHKFLLYLEDSKKLDCKIWTTYNLRAIQNLDECNFDHSFIHSTKFPA